MRKLMYFRIAGRDVHLPKLIGSFILFAALLMFVQASAIMFDSWDNLKYYDRCVLSIDTDLGIEEQRAQFNTCSDTLYKATGIVARVETPKLTARQFWSALLGPVAGILFWLAILFMGYTLYKSGDLVLPIEEKYRVMAENENEKAMLRKKRK